MDVQKLKKIPVLLSLMAVTVLSLSLFVVGCGNTTHKDEDIISHVDFEIPLAEEDAEEESHIAAPADVKYFNVEFFDINGKMVYDERVTRTHKNTFGNMVKFQICRVGGKDGVGVPYGAKTALISYLDYDAEYMGYTLLKGIELNERNSTKTLHVDHVVPLSQCRPVEKGGMGAIAVSLVPEKDVVILDTDNGEDTTNNDIDINAVLSVMLNPDLSTDTVNLEITDSSLLTYEAPINFPDDETGTVDVLTASEEQTGRYTAHCAGLSYIFATYCEKLISSEDVQVRVIDKGITGTAECIFTNSAIAALGGTIDYIETAAGHRYHVSDGKTFQITDTATTEDEVEMTIYNSDNVVLGIGFIPVYTIKYQDYTAHVSIDDEHVIKAGTEPEEK